MVWGFSEEDVVWGHIEGVWEEYIVRGCGEGQCCDLSIYYST